MEMGRQERRRMMKAKHRNFFCKKYHSFKAMLKGMSTLPKGEPARYQLKARGFKVLPNN